jgi:histidinol-phosphate aminotransferase
VILCNPNNPSGAYLTLDEVRAFAEALPERVLLILDEAYVEFVDDPAYSDSHALASRRRTSSWPARSPRPTGWRASGAATA